MTLCVSCLLASSVVAQTLPISKGEAAPIDGILFTEEAAAKVGQTQLALQYTKLELDIVKGLADEKEKYWKQAALGAQKLLEENRRRSWWDKYGPVTVGVTSFVVGSIFAIELLKVVDLQLR